MRLIDADALRERIMGEPTDAHYPSWYASMVDAAPTIDAAPVRRGEWIMIKGDSEIHKHNTLFECSKCGVLLTRCQSFCPNCGADMRRDDG